MMQNMKQLLWERATINRNDYGENVKSYSSIGNVDIFISFASNAEQYTNQVLYDDYSHIGLTREKNIQKDDRIGEKYIVKYTLESRPFYRVFLQELI